MEWMKGEFLGENGEKSGFLKWLIDGNGAFVMK